MLLQHTVLRDGSTWAARAWTCVAGHNIVPRAQQTNCFNTPHKHASATQHQHTSRVNKAERSGCSTHSSQARGKCSCSQGHTPETNQFSTGRQERREAVPHREELSRTRETSGSRASVAARTMNTTPQVASVRTTCSHSATGNTAVQACAGVNGGNGFGALGEEGRERPLTPCPCP